MAPSDGQYGFIYSSSGRCCCPKLATKNRNTCRTEFTDGSIIGLSQNNALRHRALQHEILRTHRPRMTRSRPKFGSIRLKNPVELCNLFRVFKTIRQELSISSFHFPSLDLTRSTIAFCDAPRRIVCVTAGLRRFWACSWLALS